MGRKKSGSAPTSVDSDDAPELTEEWFATADYYEGDKLVHRGRPRKGEPKRAVSLRVDPEVLAYFQSSGPGWQTRINQALRKAAGL